MAISTLLCRLELAGNDRFATWTTAKCWLVFERRHDGQSLVIVTDDFASDAIENSRYVSSSRNVVKRSKGSVVPPT